MKPRTQLVLAILIAVVIAAIVLGISAQRSSDQEQKVNDAVGQSY